MLHDGEIDNCQHTGIHSDSLHMNVKKVSTIVEKANIDTFVITEGNVAQTALWTAYGSVQVECRLSPPPMIYLYHDCPQIQILSVMNWEQQLLKYTTQES